MNSNASHIIQKWSDFFVGLDLQAVTWSALNSWKDVSAEDLGTVVESSVQLTQVVVLAGRVRRR